MLDRLINNALSYGICRGRISDSMSSLPFISIGVELFDKFFDLAVLLLDELDERVDVILLGFDDSEEKETN